MKSTRAFLGPAVVLVISMVTGGWFLQRGVAQDQNVYLQVRLLQEVVDRISDLYVDPVDEAELYDSAIDGIIRELGDPNTAFLDSSAYENLRIRTEGEYGGAGLEIVPRGEWITVVGPLPGTPGARAGIRAGDQIAEVEGRSARGWSSNRMVDALRGQPGTSVAVKIRRPGVQQLVPFSLTRAIIQVRSVPFVTMVSPGIGYVPLQMVSESSEEEVRKAVASLEDEGLRGLILDLRRNPGGLLDEGVELADLFLERGQSIVETRGRAAGQSESFAATGSELLPGLPLVVLVDERSASASEIIAGALQDHDRALVVGVPSFGKGSVQSLYRLSGGNVLRLTTARWYTPSGRSIQKAFEERATHGEDAVLTLDGGWLERSDTAGLPTFSTDSGRRVYGGGGITPDLLVLPDTLLDAEEAAVLRLFQAAGSLWTALFNHSVSYLQDHPGLREDFQLTSSEMEAFFMRFPEYGVDAAPEVIRSAERFLRYHLEREIALQKWGDEGEFRQKLPNDLQIDRAIELLNGAQTREALFRVAGIELGGGTSEREQGDDPGVVVGLDAQVAAPSGDGGARPE
jgi:carboxyl-terminal processing protease